MRSRRLYLAVLGKECKPVVDRDIYKLFASMQHERPHGEFINLYDPQDRVVVQLLSASSRSLRIRTHFVDSFYDRTIRHTGRMWFEIFDFSDNKWINV